MCCVLGMGGIEDIGLWLMSFFGSKIEQRKACTKDTAGNAEKSALKNPQIPSLLFTTFHK